MRSTRPFILLIPLILGILRMQSITAQVCPGELQANLVNGGDFGSGLALSVLTDPGLSPIFQYNGSAPPPDGFYVIANSSNFGNPSLCWTSTGDNSADPNGYMMLLNAGNTPGIFFQQTIEVCEGIRYVFRADLLNLFRTDCLGTIPPSIDFLVNGIQVFSSGAIPQDELWHSYEAEVEIPDGTTLVTLALRTNAPGGIGNALAIDNIEFRHCAPVLSLPAITWACASGVLLSIDEALIPYPTPSYQWQRSFDGGTSWQDIAGANMHEHFILNPIAGVQYRVLAANGAANIDEQACRAVSSATTIQIQQPIVQYVTPVICQGDTLVLGDQPLTQSGSYQIPLPGNSGCDSLLVVTLFTNPSYDHWFFQDLCYGEEFMGQTFFEDGLLGFSYPTSEGCDSTVNHEIRVFSPQNLSIQGDTLTCAGETPLWQASPGYFGYSWSHGVSGNNIQLAEPGTYTVSVMNSQGCSVEVTQTLSWSAPYFDAEGMDASCPGGLDGRIEILFEDGGIAPYTYQISGSDMLGDLAAGSYWVVQTDALGCESEQLLFIGEQPWPDVQLLGLPTDIVNLGDFIPLSLSPALPADTYTLQWQGEGRASCQNCPETNWQVLGNLVQALISGAGGCELVLEGQIDARQRYRIYWPNAFSPNGDGQNDLFAPGLSSHVRQVVGFYIFDRWGNQLFQAQGRSPEDPFLAWDGQARGKPASSGVYMYQAEILFEDGQTRSYAGEFSLLR